MGWNLTRARNSFDRQVKRFNNGVEAFLVREDVQRAVTAGMLDFDPRQRDLVLDGARRVLLSALDPGTGQPMETPPDHEQDKLLFAGELYRIVAPVRGPRPGGEAVYYELEVLYDSGQV